MFSRFSVPVVAAALAGLLLAQPARAQTAEEMAGPYHMTVVSRYGPCGVDPTFEVEVKGFEGGAVSLLLGGQPYSAPFDPAARSFHLETQDNGMGFRATLDGRFHRTADAVVLEADATWAVGCGGKIVGQHPAAGSGAAAGPAGPAGEGAGPTVTALNPGAAQPPPTYTFGGAVAPPPAAACPPADPFSWMCMLLWLVFFLLGLAVGWLMFHGDGERRRKAEADAATPPAPPPTPDPEDLHD